MKAGGTALRAVDPTGEGLQLRQPQAEFGQVVAGAALCQWEAAVPVGLEGWPVLQKTVGD